MSETKMTSEELQVEADRAEAVLTVLAQAIIDDTHSIVRCVTNSGREFTGVKVGDRVIIAVLPEGEQGARPEGTTLQ